jgi:FAD dependent oxidoreductase
MAELRADVVVLGAGMVGIGAALHLQKRGRDVVLIDRHDSAGEETSFGNGGLIECASVFPYMFPRDVSEILRYALNRGPHVRYRIADLPVFLPWLARYYLASSPERALASAMADLPLIRRSLIEHEALISEAGVPGRMGAAAGAQTVSVGRADRCQAVEGRATLSSRHAAGDREGAAPSRPVVRFRPPAPRLDAGTCDRPPAGGNDDRREAVCRSQAVCRGTFWLTIDEIGGACAAPALSGRLRDRPGRGDTAKVNAVRRGQ